MLNYLLILFIANCLCPGSSAESIDSIKDYEEDFFQNSRLLRQVIPSNMQLLKVRQIGNSRVEK